MTPQALAFAFGTNGNGVPHLAPGWSIERRWSWSLGDCGHLAIPLPPGQGEVLLELELGPCLLPPAVPRQRFRLASGATTLFAEDLCGNATICVPIPAALASATTLPLTLHHPDAACPADHGAGEDRRRLGVRLFRAVSLRVPAPITPAGPNRRVAALAFGAAGPGMPALVDGWSDGEGDYVWAVGHRSTLRLRAPESPGPHRLLLDLNPALRAPDLPRQRVLIGANGRQIGALAFDRRVPLAFPLPPPEAEGWEITFDNIDAARPRDFLRYRDGRNFAFMLASVCVLDAPPPAPLPSWPLPRNQAELLARFESLGHACDFAKLQIEHRVGRLGLLHLSGITTFGLVRGLLDGFRQLGRPDTLDLTSRDGDDRAWFAEPHYDLTGPTSVPLGPDMEGPALRQTARTLPFLARRLLETIAGGETVFLLRRDEPPLREEAEAILAALRLHGDATLLWLAQDGTLAPGAARRCGPRLLQAGLDRPATESGWLAALDAAARLAAEA